MTSRSRGVKTEKGESPTLCASPTFVSLLLSVRHSAMTLQRRLLSLLTDFQVINQTRVAQLGGGQYNQWFSADDLLRGKLSAVSLAAQRYVVHLPAVRLKMTDRLRLECRGVGLASPQTFLNGLQCGI